MEDRFRVKGDKEIFSDPIEASLRAAYLSQTIMAGEPIEIERGVKYKHKKDYEWYTIAKVTLPNDVTVNGPVAIRDDGNKQYSIYHNLADKSDNASLSGQPPTSWF